MTLTERIKNEFGSLKHFCKVANINVNSLSVIIAGGAKSQPCVDALIEHGFIDSIDDLPKFQPKAK